MDGKLPRRPADLPLVTLDNNALIALRQDEPEAVAVRHLLQLNRSGRIAITVSMSTAMGAQRPDERLGWQEQAAWLESLGMARTNIFTSDRSVGFTVPDEPDVAWFDPRLEIQLTERIHAILFPTIPFIWFAYRQRETANLTDIEKQAVLALESQRSGLIRIPPRPTPALDALDEDTCDQLRRRLEKLRRTWFNAKNDALGFQNHLTQAYHTTCPEHAVFVTSDCNFRKQTKFAALRALGYRGVILPPMEAVAFLHAAVEDRRAALTQ